MSKATQGQVRVGTIHGFKGLEADVVILVGFNKLSAQHPEWFYLGATRARAALVLLALEEWQCESVAKTLESKKKG